MMNETTNQTPRMAEADRPIAGQGMQIQAESLFQGGEVLVIEFRGERYQLRKTRNGKLILTK